jgi:hypothetical protein
VEPAERDNKLANSGGFYLFVTRKGAKSQRLKYRGANQPGLKQNQPGSKPLR